MSFKMKAFGVLLHAERHLVKIVAGDEKFIMEKKGILWTKERKFVRQHITNVLNDLRIFLKI